VASPPSHASATQERRTRARVKEHSIFISMHPHGQTERWPTALCVWRIKHVSSCFFAG
jgi:hypothetical protein